MVEAFPLCWPSGFPRHAGNKSSSPFKSTIARARDGVIAEIKRMNGTGIIISTNIPVKLDGHLYATQRSVSSDLGVAVYFNWKGDQKVLACDKYGTIWENLKAIEKSINAMRGLERWGCSDILNRTFTGFKALPPADISASQSKPADHWMILGISPTKDLDAINAAYKKLARSYHPDAANGSTEQFIKLREAYAKVITEATYDQG